jgi:hypothetical protein
VSKKVHAATQANDPSSTHQSSSRFPPTALSASSSAKSILGRHLVFAVSAFCVVLALVALAIAIALRHHSSQQENSAPREGLDVI